ncbi:MAG: B12-binding domain-containing radical SAM protein [Candidatus Omnitrophica bacterium]|nr:B12-binding domain-containing radical SAM protein [Candidatus Omnitrophota bacterium]
MRQDADVILVYPKTGIDFGATVAPPHAVLTLAAPLEQKSYQVKIIDQRVDPFWLRHLQEYLQRKPICVGISSMTGTQIYFALEIAKVVRNASNGEIPIVWGGAHPSTVPEQTLESEYVDVVCIGEGDITFMELVEAFRGMRRLNDVKGIAFKEAEKTILTASRPLLDVETLLPVPWHLIDVESYIHRDFYIKKIKRSLDIGQTSRGCPFQCGFCSSATLRQRKWRAMSVKKSLEERILEPVKRFNLDGIWIRDDEFYIDRNRTYQICEGIVNSRYKIKWYTSGTRVDVFNLSSDEQIIMLKRSGANTLKFGAESGSNRILDLMQKGIYREDTLKANLKARRLGIIPAFALMIGFPTETFDDIHQTIDLFVKLKKDNPQAQFEVIGGYTAFPGTPLYDLSVKMGLRAPQSLPEWINWVFDDYDREGRKMPWFNNSDRKKIGNITYMSILGNSAHNAIEGVENNFMRFILKLFFKPISAFERFKLRNKHYTFAPELDIARILRKRIFYRNYKMIR